MSRNNGTNRAGAAIGMNPYGWETAVKEKGPQVRQHLQVK